MPPSSRLPRRSSSRSAAAPPCLPRRGGTPGTPRAPPPPPLAPSLLLRELKKLAGSHGESRIRPPMDDVVTDASRLLPGRPRQLHRSTDASRLLPRDASSSPPPGRRRGREGSAWPGAWRR
ncbi:Os02g0452700 [Oryza sativa Japonica Group]|uniref:Os02g0452700 protein n=2 Tax=Oryza sativa subsp. japonica TaxID=39947 RepID=B9EZS6_ORYSJ|nr:hypothetical protein OsJ_06595 [Oryza sativa Japonica Group]BAD19495.1 unknown protein [Oryza sativa Japonica Group]BAF08678.1 Os02g0452700 [Oryza sativa Japonica Group]BAG98329.1 unnamed protein product [Oryza sativa Japonica Group]BAS78508.1 Os02g0452700 [Oryza sativa Japonica Group]|eukprot:NP_001046764.1 Os02g0452700 [Oryza sativa Japonica Group]